MARSEVLAGDEWREALAAAFNGLAPDAQARDVPGADGWLSAAQLGSVAVFHVAGGTQVLRRTSVRARQRPSDMLKVCIQRAGSATIQQDDREAVLTPGQMTIYDIDKPYVIRLQGDWRCAVIAFPRTGLVASRHFIDGVICRPTQATDGPGSVLAPLVASAVSRNGAGERAADFSGTLMGRASLDLLKAALAESDAPEHPDAVRLQIDAYIQSHLADPELSHGTVAAAHHMSERTLHRLFGGSDRTVTELIRSYRLEGIWADLQSPRLAKDGISQIAARWGVHDMPHLTRTFRARYGVTPSETRAAQ
jgi:AraC-like DNA-binding protein